MLYIAVLCIRAVYLTDDWLRVRIPLCPSRILPIRRLLNRKYFGGAKWRRTLLCAHRQPLADIRVGTLRFPGIGCRTHPLSLESTNNYSQSQISHLLFTSLSLQRMEMSQQGKYAAHLRELSAGRTEYHEDDGKTKRELSKNNLKNKKEKISIIRRGWSLREFFPSFLSFAASLLSKTWGLGFPCCRPDGWTT